MKGAALVRPLPARQRPIQLSTFWLALFFWLSLTAVVGLLLAVVSHTRRRSGACWPASRVLAEVSSTPSGAKVFVENELVGVTPLIARTRLCSGRRGHVYLQREGFATWEWVGLLPSQGSLQLSAALLPAVLEGSHSGAEAVSGP